MVVREARRSSRPLLRVRTGCLTCRTRKKKCDERKPACIGCTRNCLRCQWPEEGTIKAGRWRSKTSTRATRPSNLRNRSSESNSTQSEDAQITEGDPEAPPRPRSSPASQPAELERSSAHDDSPPPEDLNPVDEPDHWMQDPLSETLGDPCLSNSEVIPSDAKQLAISPFAQLYQAIPVQPSFMPQLDQSCFSILGYYIQVTANSMANGATLSNPFLVQLLPLAASSDLVLESILAQSCAHRALRAPDSTGSEAIVRYNKSLRSLRTAITNVSNPEDAELLAFTVSMLILCFTETARGDVNGTIFYHLRAANSLLPRLLTRMNHTLPKELRSFLVEYYIYTSTSSIISIDAQTSPHIVLCDQLLLEGQQMVDSGYNGSLCGCWLDLLLFIPIIFRLGEEWVTQGTSGPNPDLIIEFANIQSELTQWEPNSSAAFDVALVGLIFRQSMLLYLNTILGNPRLDEQSMHAATIQAAVTRALDYLGQLEPAKQINTSLCWPIAVVGSCALCVQQQEAIRVRLRVMVDAIGLGNISKTLEVLEHMWSRCKTGPWEISQAMQEAGIWISFA